MIPCSTESKNYESRGSVIRSKNYESRGSAIGSKNSEFGITRKYKLRTIQAEVETRRAHSPEVKVLGGPAWDNPFLWNFRSRDSET
jgi:hypothetical protein